MHAYAECHKNNNYLFCLLARSWTYVLLVHLSPPPIFLLDAEGKVAAEHVSLATADANLTEMQHRMTTMVGVLNLDVAGAKTVIECIKIIVAEVS